tara:strand:+ start:255 stop:434 length:180 start_codon:yes stop_codon:yes gene_type:complete
MTISNLNKKFNSLNKKYVKLDNTWSNDMTDFEEIDLSEKLENIQIEMSKISNELELLDN